MMTNQLKFFLAAGISLTVFIVYLFTTAPSVVQIDAGELATVQLTCGIAHPTGYPLFAVAGYLFSLLPLGLRPIFQMNVLAAFWCAGALSFLFLTAIRMLSHAPARARQPGQIKKNKTRKGEKNAASPPITSIPPVISPVALFASAGLGMLSLAFSKTYWFQSTSVEVYSMHIFLMSAIIWSLSRAWRIDVEKEKAPDRAWYLSAFLLALGFSNHLTTLLILPGVAYVFFSTNGFNKKAFALIGKMLLLFFITLIITYSYLPLRAGANPALNWGNPADAERFIRHISGKQYQVWMFVSMEAAQKQFAHFIDNVPLEFTFATVFILAGIVFLFTRFPRYLIFTLATAIVTVLYSINYDIVDIDSYFLLCYVALALIAVAGFYWWLTTDLISKLPLGARIGIAAAVVIAQAVITYPKVDQHNTRIYEDYTRAVLHSVQKDAIIFSYQWDYFVSAAYYFQFVEKERPDVTVIDKELLRRSWYYTQLGRNHPAVIGGVKNEISTFLGGLQKFERDESFDANYLETWYRAIMTGLITTNIDKHPYYLGPELVEGEMQRGEFALPQGMTLVPDLFFYRVTRDTSYCPVAIKDFQLRFPAARDAYAENIYQICAGMLSRRALYELHFNYPDRAKFYVAKLKKDFPDFIIPDQLVNSGMN